MRVHAKVALAVLLLGALPLASAAQAQLASHPHDGEHQGSEERRGIYLGLFGSGGLQLSTAADAKFGYGGEARLGFSFNRAMQLYVAGDVHNASGYGVAPNTISQQLILITVHLHRFAFQDRSGVGVYYDGGVGVGLASPGFGPTGSTGVGLGYSASLGVEIPVAPHVSLAPEFFFHAVNGATSESGFSGSINVVGIQFGVLYY